MKTRNLFFSVLAAMAFVVGFSSCDKVKTDKFDGTYKCYTSETSSEDDFVLNSFTAYIDMQAMEVDIDGMTFDGIDVDNDGNFRISDTRSYALGLASFDFTIDGTVTDGGDISGTYSESIDVIGIGIEVIPGTFSGSSK